MAFNSIWQRPIAPGLLVGLLFTVWPAAIIVALVTTGVMHDVSASLSFFLMLIVITVGILQLKVARWWLYPAHAALLFVAVYMVLLYWLSHRGASLQLLLMLNRVAGAVIWSMIFIVLAASIAGWLRMWRYGPRPLRSSKSAVPIE